MQALLPFPAPPPERPCELARRLHEKLRPTPLKFAGNHTHCTKDTLLLKPRDNTLSLKTSIEKKGGRRSYDTIKVDALILRQKSKPVFSWYVDVNDQWFLVRNSDFFIKAKYCHLLF